MRTRKNKSVTAAGGIVDQPLDQSREIVVQPIQNRFCQRGLALELVVLTFEAGFNLSTFVFLGPAWTPTTLIWLFSPSTLCSLVFVWIAEPTHSTSRFVPFGIPFSTSRRG